MTPRHRVRILLQAALVALFASSAARADVANFDLAGKIYTKWLYQNDDSQGVLSLGNPFWPDNVSGHNGVGSEFELKVMGAVSKAVRAEVRLKSRFGALWQDWWENGDVNYPEPNTSGESLGQNHAQNIKLRGFLIDANLPLPTVRSVLVGSSDLGMFDPWTIGKVRYIDRDNAKGTFLFGGTEDSALTYTLAAIALPKLFAGPRWSTGIGDGKVDSPFWSRDWAYAAKLRWSPGDLGRLTVVGSVTRDAEIDVADPDALGSLYPDCADALGNGIEGCEKDHAVETVTRYSNAVGTLEYKGWPAEFLGITALVAASSSDVNEDVTFNGVAGDQGVFPIVYADVVDWAGTLQLDLVEIADSGLSVHVQAFRIGEHFNTIFGARREADVLLTDGFLEGGQLPTMNLANEFIDFDEAWYESAIGWQGVTLVPELELDTATLGLEVTALGYDSDRQARDVDEIYPTFLHHDGFTDTDLYDYANSTDRGRDPRAVFHPDQQRQTLIGVLRGRWEPDTDTPLGLGFKLKAIADRDERSDTTAEDDYFGLQLSGRLEGDARLGDALRLGLGAQIEHWDEEARSGTLQTGYGDDTTDKVKVFTRVAYDWSGFAFAYYLEYLRKDQARERKDDQLWNVVRSKATLEVLW